MFRDYQEYIGLDSRGKLCTMQGDTFYPYFAKREIIKSSPYTYLAMKRFNDKEFIIAFTHTGSGIYLPANIADAIVYPNTSFYEDLKAVYFPEPGYYNYKKDYNKNSSRYKGSIKHRLHNNDYN